MLRGNKRGFDGWMVSHSVDAEKNGEVEAFARGISTVSDRPDVGLPSPNLDFCRPWATKLTSVIGKILLDYIM